MFGWERPDELVMKTKPQEPLESIIYVRVKKGDRQGVEKTADQKKAEG